MDLVSLENSSHFQNDVLSPFFCVGVFCFSSSFIGVTLLLSSPLYPQHPYTSANQVMLPQLQAVFVDNVKVASTKMRKAFASVGGTWYRDKGSAKRFRNKNAVPVQLTQDSKRTHAADLPDIAWETYTFFSFVRDPVSRFASGHAQAVAAGVENVNETWASWYENPNGKRSRSGKKSQFRHVAGTTFQELLAALEAGTFVNEHYQSQLWRLTPNRHAQGPSVPLHFVGRLETFDESWRKLLNVIAARSKETPGLAVEQAALKKIRQAMSRSEKANSRKSSSQMKQEIYNDPDLHKRVEQLYASDYDCFGFVRKYDQPDVTPSLQLGEFNYKRSWWHKYPRAYTGLAYVL